ncbi:PREDICTED: transmembrane protein 262 [Thamnophis sirtalis]|uniref:Transmembrane protein 262 n=1 Tax=Thamnophis sirtalis TaxID=35019 RepID=A0A6I9Z1R4_9SAUR|nr:PREDICTED: transmembrane protein 262 [Thamnophis sirtalis]XP_032090222.1 transmembrane protein 262-like [Thamnophis elegans]
MGSWKDPFLTVTFPSKVIFIISSWVLFVINLGVIIGDLYHFLVSQRGDLMSFHFTVSLLFSHVTSFYLALIASVYTMQADDGFLTCLSLTSLVANFSLYLARFWMDYLTIEYREEKY